MSEESSAMGDGSSLHPTNLSVISSPHDSSPCYQRTLGSQALRQWRSYHPSSEPICHLHNALQPSRLPLASPSSLCSSSSSPSITISPEALASPSPFPLSRPLDNDRKYSTTSIFPPALAESKGMYPLPFAIAADAPCSTRSLTVERCPPREAQFRLVLPNSFTASRKDCFSATGRELKCNNMVLTISGSA
jgi:hypothetical protein